MGTRDNIRIQFERYEFTSPDPQKGPQKSGVVRGCDSSLLILIAMVRSLLIVRAGTHHLGEGVLEQGPQRSCAGHDGHLRAAVEEERGGGEV